MSAIRPFRALRYDPTRVALERVLAPPYDVIGSGDRARLAGRDPHNAVRLELARGAGDETLADYAGVARRLAAWQREGVLRRDPRPALYALRQRFTGPDGEAGVRDGCFALLRLEDYKRGIVRPHERTLAAPKADRLRLLRATRANLSPVFLLYEDPEDVLGPRLAAALETEPALRAADDGGVENTLAILEPGAVDAVQRFLEPRPLVIADGHHRYETALHYRDECRAAGSVPDGDAPCDWVLAYLANARGPGTRVLPIHRVVLRGAVPDDAAWRARLPGWSQARVPVPDAEALPGLLRRHLTPLSDRHAFAADDGSGTLRVFSRPLGEKPRELTVRRVHREVIRDLLELGDDDVREGAVAFAKSAFEAARDVRAGRGVLALYLNPLSADDVFRTTAAGELLPQKSTFFHPKVPTGLVFRSLDEGGA